MRRPGNFLEIWTARAPSELAVFPLHSPHKDFFLNKVALRPHRAFSHKSCLFLAARTHTSHGTKPPLKLLFLNKVPTPARPHSPISLSARMYEIKQFETGANEFAEFLEFSISCRQQDSWLSKFFQR